MDVATALPVALVAAALTQVGNAVAGWLKSRAAIRKVDGDVGIRIEEHRDNLTFQLLRAAKDEVVAARAEVAMFRPLAKHLAHFEEAITLIERLVASVEENELVAAREAALKFLNRMHGSGNMQQMSVAAANFYDDISAPERKK